MRCRGLHRLLTLLCVLALLPACGRKPRVIPEKKLVRIYMEMFIADQWVRDHSDARKVADTTLFFDPIFRRHGYTFADYDRSVHYYLDKPDKYADILSQASDRLRAESERQAAVLSARREREMELDSYRRWFIPRDYSNDSLRWAGPGILWPPAAAPVDSLAEKADTLPPPRDERVRPNRMRMEELEFPPEDRMIQQ